MRFLELTPLRRRVIIAMSASLLVLATIGFFGLRWANARALADGRAAAEQLARTHAGLFASELQKYRLLPLVLAEYPEVRAALDHKPGALLQLNDKLKLLAAGTNAAVIYLLDDHGMAIAASNSQLPTSFIGHDYRFRLYFRDALTSGHAEEFALGAVTHRPGLFLAHRVAEAGKPIGVIVVKVEFDRIEAQWKSPRGPTVVTDSNGMVVLTSQPDWRFRKLGLVGSLRRPGTAVTRDAVGRRFVAGEVPVPMPGWTLRHLEPLDPFESTPATLVRELLFAAAIITLIALGFVVRAHEKRLLQRTNQAFLELEVERRTAELRESNAQLRVQSSERLRADMHLRQAREELAQANRLGIIGQITAGVAHEVNQPVAAIRTSAENASRLLARSEVGRTQRNLDSIIELTERIGQITAELRHFARRGTPSIGTVSLTSAIDGALRLVGDRIRSSKVAIKRPELAEDLTVVADSVRLEQIFVNLIQNALDAMIETPDPCIEIRVRSSEQVVVTVADNGPGIAPDLVDALFTPFVTGKAEGLGLGLGIARDIAREFGGDILLIPSPLSGAAFDVILRNADV
jgi:two-component system C4-dicarboxylate transport sensor histidine kinase DctB